MYPSSKARSIGVSNFTVAHLEALKRTAVVWPPSVNQVECHPLYQQAALREYCAKEGIVLQAYASLGGQDASKATWAALGGRLLDAPPVLAAAARAQGRAATEGGEGGEGAAVTPAQVLLRWALQKGAAVVPKTGSAARMAENAAIFHFELSAAEVAAIDALAANAPDGSGRLCWVNDPLRMLEFE